MLVYRPFAQYVYRLRIFNVYILHNTTLRETSM